MNILSYRKWFALVVAVFGALTTFAWAATFPTNFTNIGSVVNTRHNMSMTGLVGISAAVMDGSRNNYEEVCVYCHTPHGGNIDVAGAVGLGQVLCADQTHCSLPVQ